MCVCVCARARARVCMFVCVVCVRACARAHVHVHVRRCAWEGSVRGLGGRVIECAASLIPATVLACSNHLSWQMAD